MSIYDKTELGNAKRFVGLVGEKFKYVSQLKEWFYWDGYKWKVDSEYRADRSIECVLDLIDAEKEAALSDLEKHKSEMAADQYTKAVKKIEEGWDKWHQTSQSAKSIKSMISLAKTQPNMTIDYADFDSKGHYLGVVNGVVDLRDGELIKGDSSFMITKKTNVKYDKEAKCPKWEELVNTVMCGNEEYVRFLQRLFGSCAVGERAQYFTFFYGEKGSNGKSTLVDTINSILGDYSAVSDPKVVTAKNASNTEYYLMSMKGLRAVLFNESNREDVQLSEALIKMTTNSGEITGRNPAGRPVQFQPTFTPIFSVNHIPTTSMDSALWRRLLILPFNHVFTGDVDPDYGAKLVKEEGAGILRWLIEGAKIYLKEGLNPPEELISDTNKEKKSGDVLGEYIEVKWCEEEGTKVPLNDIRKGYAEWCVDNGYERRPSALTFRRDMKDRGYDVRKGTGNLWYVFGLRSKLEKMITNKKKNEGNIVKIRGSIIE